jgi:SAM-dependent methyltransferase
VRAPHALKIVMNAAEFDPDRYFVAFGAAFVRGRLGESLPATAFESDVEAFKAGLAAGLKMHKFKRLDRRRVWEPGEGSHHERILPRVRRVISTLSAFQPTSLLDVGSGRGAFLWPLLDAFPDLKVTSIDMSEQRATDLQALARGGMSERFAAQQMNATAMAFEDLSFDGVTLLEVLEHMTDPAAAAREAMRVAQRFVVASVPSKPDDNPEHIQLFNQDTLTALFMQGGARKVTIEHVPGHMIALAR